MHPDLLPSVEAARALVEGRRTHIGIDLVQVARVAESVTRFGAHYARRLLTDRESADVGTTPVHAIERLAERFAAKEAALKALGLCDCGIDWRDIEVQRGPDGWRLALHGRAAAMACANALDISLTLHHGDGHVLAIVAAAPRPDC